MTTPHSLVGRLVLGLLLFCLATALVGCGTSPPEFRLNAVYVRKQEKIIKEEMTQDAKTDVTEVMVAMFGTPADPKIPSLEGIDLASMLDIDKLRMAAGAVGSDEEGIPRGLYRKHCVHCHGVDGDGAGPTASFLNPYPRDYRMGLFKFKSTLKGEKPTHEDLDRILKNGIPDTAMPSFKLLLSDDREALLQYVIYLSIRGEVERRLIELSSEYDYINEERLVDVLIVEKKPDDFEFQLEAIREVIGGVAQRWLRADSMVMQAQRPEGWKSDQKSVDHGRDLFYGAIANCIKCHGDSALGDGQTTDFDDWTKEIEPTDPDAVREFVALGAMKPRNIRPRNLRKNVYRGGRRPIDLYWRLLNGIEGTPMPAVPMTPSGAPADYKGLSEADVWHLIDYVRSLPLEALSQPTHARSGLQRERL